MKKISFYMLTAEETFTVSNRFTVVFDNCISEDAFFQKLAPKIKSANNKFSLALNRITDKQITIELAEADTARDTAFIGFRDYAKAFLSNPGAKKKKAANKLIKLIKKIGWSIWNEGYMTETAQLKSLIAELKDKEYQAAMKTIEATEWFDNMVTTQKAFEELYGVKVVKEAGYDSPLISEIKAELTHYINPLLGYIEILAEVDGNPYKETALQLDEIISEAMSVARSRKTRNDNSKEDNDETENREMEI